MIISHKHKFIYFAIPKCASTSIRHHLDKFADINSNRYGNKPDSFYHKKWHITPEQLQTHFQEMNWDWDKYFKFSFTRNPWERVLSTFRYNCKRKKDWEAIGCPDPRPPFLPVTNNFKNYILDPKKQFIGQCYKWVYDQKENNMLDFVGKVENLQNDFNTACKLISIPSEKISRRNQTKGEHYTKLYDNKMTEIISKVYIKDIDYFGYKFGD